ncbi:transcription factor EC-like [Ostrea edulis]|uniref:transcription factor EC-like n=1 Tax=Ostrea edulis TaxID=37623 RepID=UPI0024AFFF9B|nr:transcription factor EC-like [Ostrea edulis]
MSTSDANKQLHAIRNQLRQMEHQYGDGTKPDNTFKSIHSKEVGEIDEARMFEDQENIITFDHNSHNTGGIQALIKESKNTFSNEFERKEPGFTTLTEFENPEQESHDPPLSGECHHAIINMEDLNDVDILLKDVISSVQIDSMSDEDLHILEQFVSCPMSEESEQDNLYQSSGKTSSASKALESEDEMDLRCKDRIRKDNHNIIERRRRYNINDRIKEISSLLPPSTHPSMKLSKGSILKAAVQCFKDLKRDQENLKTLEAKQKAMNSKYQKMQLRTTRPLLKNCWLGVKVPSRKHENEAAPQTSLKQPSMPDSISDELLLTDDSHLHSPSTDINVEECDILLDLFKSQSPHMTVGQMETDPALPSHSSKQLLSTVTSPPPTTNMLEVLLKRSDKTPLQANFTESFLDSTL